MMMAPESRKRDKPILSCYFCRSRKQTPCSACARRGTPQECIYSTSEQERKNAIDYRPRGQLRKKLTRLETLVTQMRDREHGVQQGTGGSLSVDDGREVYTGSSHWASILEDIGELKHEVSDDEEPSEQSWPFAEDLPRISLLSSAHKRPKEEFIAQLPGRSVADRLLMYFFNEFDLASHLLDRETFLSEYEAFWKDTSAAPVMWLGFLFSILSMATILQRRDVGDSAGQDMMEVYRTCTIHCLITGDYLRPSMYTMETLILLFGIEDGIGIDSNLDQWFLIGTIVRVALRMGLHRDPSHWPKIPAQQADVRRRLWMILYQMDFFTSTRVGLPRIIKDSQCDSKLPERAAEHTARFLNDRHAIIKVAAEIYDATEAGSPSDTALTAFNGKIQRAMDSLPESLTRPPLELATSKSPGIILSRIFIDILQHKAIYLLHRRSFVSEFKGHENESSYKQCIDSALAILEHQKTISEETRPGGLLFSMRWKVENSLSHEFLQATMMMCFALSKFDETKTGLAITFAHKYGEMRDALGHAKGIWEENARHSKEAQKAVRVIQAVLKDHGSTAMQSPEVQNPAVYDYAQNMALDPSMFAIDDDVAAFGSMWDAFVDPMDTQLGANPYSAG